MVILGVNALAVLKEARDGVLLLGLAIPPVVVLSEIVIFVISSTTMPSAVPTALPLNLALGAAGIGIVVLNTPAGGGVVGVSVGNVPVPVPPPEPLPVLLDAIVPRPYEAAPGPVVLQADRHMAARRTQAALAMA